MGRLILALILAICVETPVLAESGTWAGALKGAADALQDIADQRMQEEAARQRQEVYLQQQARAEWERRQREQDIRAEFQRRETAAREAATTTAQLRQRLSSVTGTAFAVAPGVFATNYHVIGGFSNLSIIDPRGKEHPAQWLVLDATNDLALVRAATLKAPALSLLPDASLRRGMRIYAAGFPRPTLQGEALKITEGIVNALSGMQDEPTTMQVSAEIQPGNSGGPLLSTAGAVAGVVVATLRVGQNVNYAIKPDMLARLLERCGCLSKVPSKGKLTAHALEPEQVVERADASVFKINASPSAYTAARLREGNLLDGNVRSMNGVAATEYVAAYHPDWASLVRSPAFKEWLAADDEAKRLASSAYPEDAIRVVDRFLSARAPVARER